MSMEPFLTEPLLNEFKSITSDSGSSLEKKISFWKKIVSSFSYTQSIDELYQLWMELFSGEAIPIAWIPDETSMRTSNLEKLMTELKIDSFEELHQWSIENRAAYWEKAIGLLGIKLEKKYTRVLNLEKGVENPSWLEGARMNIVESCFHAKPNQLAIIQGSEESEEKKSLSYGELAKLVNRIASGLLHQGFQPGDAVIMYMPLTIESIATYLAIVKAGMVVVSVADSFSSAELKKRIDMTGAKAVFTCDAYVYGGKQLQVASKVIEADAPVILLCNYHNSAGLRKGKKDIFFHDLLRDENFSSYITNPDATTNILFSSGTTKEPKSIPWTHLTPIKCAADGYFHQNIMPGDVLSWTTGMGWMMAPWLIYAGLINKATIAIFTGAATTEKFGKFAEETKVNILGTIPSVVKVWKSNEFIKKFYWDIKVFSSTGEPSNAEDYFYLMALAKFKAPVIEYCGGTEIGGGYITGTVVQPASPATFTTPALGMQFYLLNPDKQPVKEAEQGEVFIVPPSIGLTQKLLNKDHHLEYYEGIPKGPKGETLRKHGDAFETFKVMNTLFYKSVGRVDDAMNLGGIKISAVEIEEVLNKHTQIFETAAISVPSGNSGPEKLVVFYVAHKKSADLELLKKELQQLLTKDLNPLFRISEIIEVALLPRTASNKLMRRELRKDYLQKKP